MDEDVCLFPELLPAPGLYVPPTDAHFIRGSSDRIPLRDSSVQCVITSPPYWGLRQYGDGDQELGLSSMEEYIQNEMWNLFVELWRVMDDGAVLWFNIGDTAIGSGGAGGDWNKGSKADRPKFRQGSSELPKKNFGLIPWRVAMVAQQVGFFLRGHVVWRKNTIEKIAIGHAKRPKTSWEPLFMFTKIPTGYRWYGDDETLSDVWEIDVARKETTGDRLPGGKAPFPFALPTKCLHLTTEPGDIVLDPHSGGGTTALAAALHGRVGIGVDLYEGVA